MAEQDFEGFHVPQQSRRDKLRVVVDNTHPFQLPDASAAGLLPSLIPSHMLGNNPYQYVKHEGTRVGMSYYLPTVAAAAASSSSSSASSSSSSSPSASSSHHQYSLDPQPALPLNANYTSIQDINHTSTTNNNQYYFLAPQGGGPGSSTALRESDLSSSFNRHGAGSGALIISNPMHLQYLPQPQPQPQALSLSLSSHHQQFNLPRSLPVGGGGVDASTSNDIRSAVPLGPFTGYASVLKGSRFLVPAQQLLDDFCYVGQPNYSERDSGDSMSFENFNDAGVVDQLMACGDAPELCKKKTRLISMLDEVYKRYKLYYQQMQTVVASFESVAGLSNAAPYTSYALKAMSKHFRSLKNAIVDQLRFSSKSIGEGSFKRSGNTENLWFHEHRPACNSMILEHQPVWRPQRGLPERAVTVLRAWLFEHFLHPYPTDTDKQTLAKQTGLSRSQVSNWFINARVRLWKPMVEEMHMLETCQSQKDLDREDGSVPSGSPSHYNKQQQIRASMKVQDHASPKRSRNQLLVPDRTCEPMNFTCITTGLASHHNAGNGVGTSNGVSLTLGLQQNNVIGLSEALPMNIARRFGLEASNEGYMGSLDGQIQHFSKDIGGRLLHDFVG